jgi:hypothetical protein
MQAEAHASGDEGAHARRSLVRRGYLFLVIFAAVIGGMSSGLGGHCWSRLLGGAHVTS